MEWRDQGILISARSHGETSAIVEVFTEHHGRHAGVVRGGASRKMKPILQPGTQVSVDWSARLETHLGSFRIEAIRSRAALLMADRLALEGLNSICAMIACVFPERAPETAFYLQTCDLLDAADAPNWPGEYALWERELLTVLGFGLDLTTCAATGATENLIYVSPKSGRAVSREGGKDWAARMLPLPGFFLGEPDPSPTDILDALQLTGHFFSQQVLPALGRDTLPEARDRLLRVLERRAKQQSD